MIIAFDELLQTNQRIQRLRKDEQTPPKMQFSIDVPIDVRLMLFLFLALSLSFL